ncbi:sugar transporter [Ruegeria sp. 2012CJ41-6]|uniref:Sugar transporter n=1 Tax=Ruegeria spongiae TaxID=2942209 RepID=A0ABT0Q8Q4_9RHOB|nr:sugar transporter [Ruegeria spongiae]MCL6285259.1 sugar transporter [Ruegeria spongiae]
MTDRIKPFPEGGAQPSGAAGKQGKPDVGARAEKGAGQGGRGGPKPGSGGPKKDPRPGAGPAVMHPVAAPAQMRSRHRGVILSFVLMVLVPLAVLIFYLWNVAEDQYSSTAGFTVRSEEASPATDMLGGLVQLTGGSVASDGDILYEYIQSQDLVREIDRRVDLRAHYGQYWPQDFLFSIRPDASLEDLIRYWQRMVRISYDQSSGLVEVRVLAFDRETAQRIAQEIVDLSQSLVNDLSTQARADAMGYAMEDVAEAEERLKSAREALTQFRTRTQIVDPAADIQSRLGVMANLQQQLAESLIEYDLLRETVSSSDPRVTTAERRIAVIRERIAIERQTFASDSTETGAVGEDYPSLIAEYESLSVDREFAEETYRVALAALDLARDNAARKSRYLATYIRPTLAEDSEFPQRFVLTGLAALLLLLFWSILALIYYSIRDRG